MINLKKNYIKKINNLDFFAFKTKKFLDKDLYEIVNKDFPLTSDNKLSQYYKDLNKGKFYFTSDDKLYKELKNKYQSMKLIEKVIMNKSFFNFYFYTLFFEYLKSADLKQFIKLFRIPLYVDKINKTNLINFIFNQITIRIEYSYMVEGAFLRPHTDNKKKLLSLMIYFPDETVNIKQQEEFGTVFYVNDDINIKNKHRDDVESFKKNSKYIYKSKYKKNLLVGFVGGTKSWHSVDPIKLDKSYVRRSININFFR